MEGHLRTKRDEGSQKAAAFAERSRWRSAYCLRFPQVSTTPA